MHYKSDLSRTEWTVLRSVDQASLWKQIITEVFGKFGKKRSGTLHLFLNEKSRRGNNNW